MRLNCIPFVVGEEPHCIWGGDLIVENREYIENLELDYYEYCAEVLLDQLSTENEKKSALALRGLYFQAMETFFAVLFAALQAPHCVAGWLHYYRRRHVLPIIQKIQVGEPFRSRIPLASVSWENIAKVINGYEMEDEERKPLLIRRYSESWAFFARRYQDEDLYSEYNGIKHGLRIHSGGFELAIGMNAPDGTPAPPEKMLSLGGSPFGTRYGVAENIAGDKCNFCIKRKSINWSARQMVASLRILSISLYNVISFLKVANGFPPNQVGFKYPSNDEYFDELYVEDVGASSFEMTCILPEKQMPLKTKKEIYASYDQRLVECKTRNNA